MYNFLKSNQLLSKHQSGFIPKDSTELQLINLTRTLYEALDCRQDSVVVYCDISKAFDRVWIKGLLHKLQQYGISDNLLHWFGSYLSNRVQRVIIDGCHSSWANLRAGVPQGSVLRPLLFLLYINDLTNCVSTNIRLFADDAVIFEHGTNIHTLCNSLQNDLFRINEWADQWLVKFSPEKCEVMLVSRKRHLDTIPLYMGCKKLPYVNLHRHLGIIMSNDLTWTAHIDELITKSYTRLTLLKRLKYTLDRHTLDTLYKSFIRPLLEYGGMVWDNCSQRDKDKIEDVQYVAGRIVSGAIKGTGRNKVYRELGWELLSNRRLRHKLTIFHSIIYSYCPPHLLNILQGTVRERTNYSLRNVNQLNTFYCSTTAFYNSYFPSCVRDWNEILAMEKDTDDRSKFLNDLKSDIPKPNSLYQFGTRQLSIIHAQMRMGCSPLKNNLFSMNIIPGPSCSCGHYNEDAEHFFFHCPLHLAQQSKLLNTLFEKNIPQSIEVLLFGDPNLPQLINKSLFAAVHSFIDESSRFS